MSKFTVTYVKAPSEPDVMSQPLPTTAPLPTGRGPRHLLAARRDFAATRAAILERLDANGYRLIGHDRDGRPVYATRKARRMYRTTLDTILDGTHA